MYHVLIVEDEVLVRRGIINLIDWSAMGITMVSDVCNGMEAWEVYKSNKPDIILTDIKMPFMDGMELIEKIRLKDKDTIIIILSCLDEFELVRKALHFGVLGYIFKLTMTETEMEDMVKRAITELESRGDKRLVNRHVDNNMDYVKEKLLKEYIFYKMYSDEEFGKIISELGLKLSPERLILCILEIDEYDFLKSSLNDENGYLIKTSILKQLNAIIDKCDSGVVFYDNEKNYILIFSFEHVYSEKAIQHKVIGFCDIIMNQITSFLHTSVSIGISDIHNGYGSLKNMCGEALKALEKMFFYGSGIYRICEMINSEEIIFDKLNILHANHILQKILSQENMIEYSRRINEIQKTFPHDKSKIKQLFFQLIQWTLRAIPFKEKSIDEYAFNYGQRLDKCRVLDDVIETYKMFVIEYSSNLIKNHVFSKATSEALRYIQCNYMKDISLQMIADHINMNPAYLSLLFKKELQVNIVDYWNEIRIEKAKDMLLETNMKLYEIAEKVGFAESTYFSKVFKKLSGVSPNEFRKTRLKFFEEGK